MEFKLRIEKCASCNKDMMKKAERGVFPYFYMETQEHQMRANNVEYISNSEVDDGRICRACEKKGKAYFACAICEDKKQSSKIQESFGDPAEHVCTDCYATVPAKEWHDKIELIEFNHQHDFR